MKSAWMEDGKQKHPENLNSIFKQGILNMKKIKAHVRMKVDKNEGASDDGSGIGTSDDGGGVGNVCEAHAGSEVSSAASPARRSPVLAGGGAGVASATGSPRAAGG